MFWGECDKAKCCMEKGLEHYRECSVMPCRKLKELFDDPEHGDRGARIHNLNNWKAQIIGELQRKGKRITGQRKILLDVILEGNWSSCKEIYYMASKKDPTIGLATVYRMVGVLEEMGFLSRGYRYSYPVENKIS